MPLTRHLGYCAALNVNEIQLCCAGTAHATAKKTISVGAFEGSGCSRGSQQGTAVNVLKKVKQNHEQKTKEDAYPHHYSGSSSCFAVYYSYIRDFKTSAVLGSISCDRI